VFVADGHKKTLVKIKNNDHFIGISVTVPLPIIQPVPLKGILAPSDERVLRRTPLRIIMAVLLRTGPAARDVNHYPGVNGEYASRRE